MSTYSNRLQPAAKPIITCCSVLPPEIVMHDAYIGGRSENNIKCVVHDDLRRKNRTTRYNCRFSAASHGLTSDFLSFIVVEHIWFFHGALQLYSASTCEALNFAIIMSACSWTELRPHITELGEHTYTWTHTKHRQVAYFYSMMSLHHLQESLSRPTSIRHGSQHATCLRFTRTSGSFYNHITWYHYNLQRITNM